ncbi:dihydroorotate dehydrogenase electron transfer subunit [Aquibacillus koreensis]|uniref:Dihydroorotate dehydrogenase B (NAD(+)), electron transfer subunit n=1 Tax=Aquibacillus koreensis TaxID=279446 RepID=A0A9X3WKW2_9BACI|nr:dihydroorotate dehydrogenase electron transfer subunit [Aquibacillus koreensis]MCT2538032.1 dihydroorotate dehydrogenase electron transfer subunit [Aquibacillus koreensis]MDC3420555.1 dihydroorotate dehydrogenase electron transfer subunit [Aquibacillus koreensis]
MINKEWMTIVAKEQIAKDTIEMTLSGSAVIDTAEPGQFVHINVGTNNTNLLRRPISIADVNKKEQTITIIFKIIGTGTDQLSKYTVGQELDVLVPCGQGYPISKVTMKKALVIGGGIGVPPLYYLAKQLQQKGIEVTAVIGFQSEEHVFYESKFSEIGSCHVVTDDGSYGFKGYVTDVLDQVDIAYDYYFSCGPTGMLKAVSKKLEDKKGYISIEQRMGCGIGACYACVVPTSEPNGFKKICKDGPVFEAKEVVL